MLKIKTLSSLRALRKQGEAIQGARTILWLWIASAPSALRNDVHFFSNILTPFPSPVRTKNVSRAT